MKVFVSHSSNDKIKINEFIKSLKILGIEVFYSSKEDTNRIMFGENFYEKIKKEIRDSDFVIAMLSNNFYKSIPSQIEMGISYAFNKDIKPVKIEKNCDYKDILKGIFTCNERVLDIYNPKELKQLFGSMSNKLLDIDECVENIQRTLENSTDNAEMKENEIKKESINTLEKLIEDGEFNLDECIFLKYIWKVRKYTFEYGWQMEAGVQKFKEWLGYDYDLGQDVKVVYENIINHFNILGLLDEAECTSYGNVKLFKFKSNHVRELSRILKYKPNLIEDECSKVPDAMPF